MSANNVTVISSTQRVSEADIPTGVEPGPSFTQARDSNDVVEALLDDRIRHLGSILDSDIIALIGPLAFGVDDGFRAVIEGACTRNRVTVLLTTEGGFIEIVRRMVDTLRHHYANVEFVVPNHAYSAGTIFVMSGDTIHMDYYSRLGPIDPQVHSQDGNSLVPALGYVERYNELIRKADNGELNVAELQVLIGAFDQAQLYMYEQERELSVGLLQEWLCKYKFKNWTVTETKKRPVSEDMRRERAKEIAETLSDTGRWHSHGHGISRDVLQDELKLVIDDFGRNSELNDAIHRYHELLTDYMPRRSITGVIHRLGAFKPYI